ncbi:MAG TPA: LysR substrate-binding domain-containing protein [Burkholderiaceae bacterium]
MDQLRAMRVFARVIDEGSFAGAARALDLAPAVVTRLIAELEGHLSTRLLNRTTRRLALTDVGEAYLERARRILAEVDEAEELATDSTKEARGHLRVLLPPTFAVHQMAKRLLSFHQQYPQVTLELHSHGPVVDVDEAFDITIVTSKEAPEGEYVARRLARSEVILCAAPEYLQAHGRPKHPRDLPAHEFLLPEASPFVGGLTLCRGSEAINMPRPSGRPLLSAPVEANYAAALHGLGIAGLPSFMLEDALLEGVLERVLPEWQMFSFTLWAALPSRKYMPARTRVFLDFLLASFGGEDVDPWLAAAGCATPRFSVG